MGNKQSLEKTNVMRILDSLGISYEMHTYVDTGAVSGVDVADVLQQDRNHVFKTLVTVGKTGNHYVFMIPVAEELDLKKAANSVGEKNIEMIKSRELLPLTGYIHGGCSPIGMKKQFTMVIDETAQLFDTVLFSAGRIGYQVELRTEDLEKAFPFSYRDVCV